MTDASLPTRRGFLQTSALAIATGLALGQSAGAEDDLVSGISLGVQSYTFRNFDLEHALHRMQALGLKYGEFYSKHIPPTSSPEQIQAFLKLCKEYEVTPVGFGVHGFSIDHEANKKIFAF